MQLSFLKQLAIFLILMGTLSACYPSSNSTEKTAAIERTDTCATNPAHSYKVFIPQHVKSDHDLPLLVAIDPHGSGQTAVDHLKEAASNYPAVLVASNLIKNNDGQYMQELDELIATARKRYPVGNRIYLAGFSGGARMVLGYAATHAVNGVIASGAFARSDELSAIKCPVMGLIGMDDFNFMETVQFLLNPSSQPSNAHIELTQASHAWPPKNRLTNAFGWFQLSNQADDRFSEKQVKQFVTAQKARIDSLIDGGDLLQAACISRNMASEETFERPGSFHSITNDIIKKAAYKQQLAQLTESLRFEMKMRQQYGKALLEKPRDWWKKELAALHEKMNSEPNEMMRMAYQRISGFIGIVCYSYAGQFAARKDTSHLRQILMVYRLAEPDNPDLKHYREVLAQLKSQQ